MLHILLIEDNEDDAYLIRQYLSNDLESNACQISHITEISQATKLLANGGIDLVLLDLYLADSRGIDSFYHLQSLCPNQAIVVMTSLDDESVAVEAVRHGAQDYIVKGHAAGNILTRIIRYAIERNRIRMELSDANTKLEHLALIDPLTGLLNRRGLQHVLSFEITRSFMAAKESVSATASIGLTAVTNRMPTINQLLEETHNALYNSKRSGKNRVSYDDSQDINNGSISPESDLKNMVVKFWNGSVFHGVKQPIISLLDRSVLGYEFCARSNIQFYEMPDDFFRVSFENNILPTVDINCLRKCLEVASDVNPNYYRHLNLLPSTLLAIPIQKLLNEFGKKGPMNKLCIEVSEQQLVGDPSCLVEVVEIFRQAGIQLAIDDVGFGRSCLESLILLEPEVVKIDKRCVKGISENETLRRSMKEPFVFSN